MAMMKTPAEVKNIHLGRLILKAQKFVNEVNDSIIAHYKGKPMIFEIRSSGELSVEDLKKFKEMISAWINEAGWKVYIEGNKVIVGEHPEVVQEKRKEG
jgi:hypothetical protein